MIAYSFDADIFCEDCTRMAFKNVDRNNQVDREGNPIHCIPDTADMECDSPQHCGNCGDFLENALTECGDNDVKDAASDELSAKIPQAWKDYYSYLFE